MDPWSELAARQRLHKELNERLRKAGKAPRTADLGTLGHDLLPVLAHEAEDLRLHPGGFRFSVRHVVFTVQFLGGKQHVIVGYRHAEALRPCWLDYDRRAHDRLGAIAAAIKKVLAGKVTPFDVEPRGASLGEETPPDA